MKFTKQEIRNLKRLCDAVSKVKDSKLKDGGWYSTEYIKIKSVNDITLSNIVKAVKKVVRSDVKKITNGTLESGNVLALQVYAKDDMSDRFKWAEVSLSFELDDITRYYNNDKFDNIAFRKAMSEIKSKLKTYTNKTIYEDRSMTTDKAIKKGGQ